MSTAIKLRGDTTANWNSNNPLLLEREIVVDTTLLRFKIGDGVTLYNSLPYMDASTVTELGLKAPLANPELTGDVNINDGDLKVNDGEINIRGQKIKLNGDEDGLSLDKVVFTQSPFIPRGTSATNAVNKGQLDERGYKLTTELAVKYWTDSNPAGFKGGDLWYMPFEKSLNTYVTELSGWVDIPKEETVIYIFEGSRYIWNGINMLLISESSSNLNGTNYIMVYGVGTPEENAAELQAAYDEAKKMPRYLGEVGDSVVMDFYKGQTVYAFGDYYILNNTVLNITIEDSSIDITEITEAEAKSTRTTVIVAPGDYRDITPFIHDASGIDVVSLTGSAGVLLNGIIVSTDYSFIRGIDCGVEPFTVNGSLPNLTVENSIGGDSSFSDGTETSSKFINCTGGLDAFGYGAFFTGILENCKLTTGTFPTPTEGGKIYNCIDGNGDLVNYPALVSPLKNIVDGLGVNVGLTVEDDIIILDDGNVSQIGDPVEIFLPLISSSKGKLYKFYNVFGVESAVVKTSTGTTLFTFDGSNADFTYEILNNGTTWIQISKSARV